MKTITKQKMALPLSEGHIIEFYDGEQMIVVRFGGKYNLVSNFTNDYVYEKPKTLLFLQKFAEERSCFVKIKRVYKESHMKYA